MSTNAADMNRGFLTVADLIARERTATESYPWAKQREQRPRALVSAADLLRREGVRIDVVPVQEETRVHVAKLLRREAELPERTESPDKRPPRRMAAIASAAALSGLTIAGLIALNPTNAGHNGNFAEGGPDGQQGSALPGETDRITPTTSVLKRASSEEDTSKQKDKASKSSGTQGSGGAGAGAGGSAPDSPADTPDQPGPPPSSSESPTPPSDNPPPAPPEEEPDDDGGLVGGVVGGVGDVVGGVTDTVGGVTDTVGGILNPTAGSISGTLPLGG